MTSAEFMKTGVMQMSATPLPRVSLSSGHAASRLQA